MLEFHFPHCHLCPLTSISSSRKCEGKFLGICFPRLEISLRSPSWWNGWRWKWNALSAHISIWLRWSKCLWQSLNLPQAIFGFPRWLSGKESACRYRRCGFDPWVGKILWRRKWQPIPVFLPGKSHGPRSLEGYSSWGRRESDMTEQLNNNKAMFLGISHRGKWKLSLHHCIPLFQMRKPSLVWGEEGGCMVFLLSF